MDWNSLLLLHHNQKSNENRIEIYLRRYLCTLKMQLLGILFVGLLLFVSRLYIQSPYWVCARIWCVLYSFLLASDRPSVSTNQINFYINNSKCTYRNEWATKREREWERREYLFSHWLTHCCCFCCYICIFRRLLLGAFALVFFLISVPPH